jgi:HSP20 family molecular chaperone IbpA
VRCWSNGQLRVSWEPRQSAPGEAGQGGSAARAACETIQLPAKVDSASAKALFTDAGQLYVRVDRLL